MLRHASPAPGFVRTRYKRPERLGAKRGHPPPPLNPTATFACFFPFSGNVLSHFANEE